MLRNGLVGTEWKGIGPQGPSRTIYFSHGNSRTSRGAESSRKMRTRTRSVIFYGTFEDSEVSNYSGIGIRRSGARLTGALGGRQAGQAGHESARGRTRNLDDGRSLVKIRYQDATFPGRQATGGVSFRSTPRAGMADKP